jgi:hypothetical protein
MQNNPQSGAKNLIKDSGQQGYAPVAGYAGQDNDKHEYKNRNDHYQFIFHDAFFSRKLRREPNHLGWSS